ncbi:MAG TPA: DNA-3-methyladenine glycosylase [Ktedonobacteraceae bacterium]|nr:DNA-3-methyladenine glycosylase [Ktedonobacteraceae bacterium]
MNNPAHWNEVISSSTAYLSDIDPIMARAIERVGLCTLIPNPQLFETLVDAIISQQISVKAADAIMGRLRAALHAEANGMISPDALLSLEEDTLRAVGLSPQKMRYIRDLTERVVNGELDLERLSELDDEEIIHELVKVKGIGRWTAEMILIFSLGRPDVLPVDDLGFLEGVREAYSLEARPTPKEMRQRGEVWHPYRTFATWYMWGVQRLKLGNERQKTRIVSL